MILWRPTAGIRLGRHSSSTSVRPIWLLVRTMATHRSGAYSDAIAALNTLQSNAAVIEAIRKSGGKLNDYAIPEMVEYLQRIGWQQSDLNNLNVIHITGTKGKGSTAAFVDSLVRHTPVASRSNDDAHRPAVGLYTSPHLVQVRERIRLDGKPIAEDLFTQYFWDVWNKLEGNQTRASPDVTPVRPVYFRYLTILAMHIFLSLRVRCTILEVGIGGKYDSTNIVPRPLATGISTLGLDHTALLGNTLEEIAVQKAGIFKPDSPATSVWQASEGARKVIQSEATRLGASSFKQLPALSPSSAVQQAKRGIPGEHQASNAQLAIELYRTFMSSDVGRQEFASDVPFDSDQDTLTPIERNGLRAARWPGRCQVVRPKNGAASGVTWCLDGAHTAESLEACAAWFVELSNASKSDDSTRHALIFNTTHDRKSDELLGGMLKAIAQRRQTDAQGLFFDQVIFCTNSTYRAGRSAGDLTDVAGPASLEAQETMQRAWKALDPQSTAKCSVLPSIEEAFEAVQTEDGSGEGRQVLVCGSLHLVGGVMSHLKEQGLLDDALNSVN